MLGVTTPKVYKRSGFYTILGLESFHLWNADKSLDTMLYQTRTGCCVLYCFNDGNGYVKVYRKLEGLLKYLDVMELMFSEEMESEFDCSLDEYNSDHKFLALVKKHIKINNNGE